MKKVFLFLSLTALIYACGNQDKPAKIADDAVAKPAENGNPSYDANRGAGKFTKVDIPAALDAPHKLTDEKLVGPGWKGVTARHTAEWIMNFATNTDEMLDKDPKAQAQLEICLVRMPNQNVSDDDARNLYEFMRKNDGVK
jgi:hypothetical protein